VYLKVLFRNPPETTEESRDFSLRIFHIVRLVTLFIQSILGGRRKLHNEQLHNFTFHQLLSGS
jgi:hypothetical protein